jgi:hypothetical protein
LNLRTHGVGFELATSVFQDVFAIEWIDNRNDYDEDRFVTIGRASGQILFVCSLHRARRTHPDHLGAQSDRQ